MVCVYSGTERLILEVIMSVSTYVLTDGADNIVQYPWSIDQMMMANPTVSFSTPVPDEVAAAFNTFPVTDTARPDVDQLWQTVSLGNPTKQDGVWVQHWTITDLTPEEHDTLMVAYRQNLNCSPLQGKIELENRGLLDAAETAVAAADKITKLAWANATIWQRTSPMIESLGAGLNLTPDDLDSLFVAAAKIYV